VLLEVLHRSHAIGRRDTSGPTIIDRYETADIVTFDTGFDMLPGIRRIQ